MPQSLANFTNAMKENYAPGLRNAINNSNVVWSEAIKNEDDIIGEEAVWSVHKGRSNATGARGDLGTLPSADRQRHAKARKDLTFQYHTIKVSGPARHLTRSDEGAFARALEVEIKGAEKDMKNSMSRQVFNDWTDTGGSDTTVPGVLARVNGAPASDVITVDEIDDSVIRHFFVGMLIDSIDDSDGTVNVSGMEIVSIDRSNKTITVDDTSTTADDDFLVVSGSHEAEMDGLRGLIGDDSSSYAGIDPTASGNDFWKPLSVGSSTTGVSEVIFDEAVEEVETDGSGDTPELFVAEHVQRRKLASVLQSQKRYEGRQMTLTGGWDGLKLARGTLVVDRYCPTNTAFGIYKPELQKFVGLDFQWDEDDGEVFFKTGTQDAVEARFKGYVQLATTLRNCHVAISLSTPSF